jgi:hypothetical protein
MRWLPDVVCQLVGIGMVPGIVINGEGAPIRVWMPHGERFHVSARITMFGHGPLCTLYRVQIPSGSSGMQL